MSRLSAAGNLARQQQRRLARRARWGLKVGEEGLKDAWHATRGAQETLLDGATNAAKRLLRRARRPVRTLLRRRKQLQEQWEFYATEWQIEGELDDIVRRDRRLVVGPWMSEVGFETLYWIPFLHWAKTAFRLDPDRVVAVSRGGVGAWYSGVASTYIDIWDDLDPAEFARRNAARGATKQLESSPLDAVVLDNVARRLGTPDFDVIHPSLMYRLFALYWSGQRPMGFVDAHTRFTRHAMPAIIDPSRLPREYVAVKFYAARSLPDTPELRAELRALVRSLARRLPVVLLDTGLVLEDDHADYALADDGLISARSWMTPRNNLGVQSQIVAGARAFVGTCGSIAWLAPRLGVDTSALFIDPQWLHAHLAVAMRAYHKLGAGRFAAADLRAVDPLGSIAAQAAAPDGVRA